MLTCPRINRFEECAKEWLGMSEDLFVLMY